MLNTNILCKKMKEEFTLQVMDTVIRYTLFFYPAKHLSSLPTEILADSLKVILINMKYLLVQRKLYLSQRTDNVMHRELSLALNMLKQHTCINILKPDINSILLKPDHILTHFCSIASYWRSSLILLQRHFKRTNRQHAADDIYSMCVFFTN